MIRTLSGIQPSGNLHLGNYFGMMKNMIDLQDTRDLYCFIVNYHALTSQRNSQTLKLDTFSAAADFLALGLDPQKCCLWVQSDLPQVTELTWILSNITSLGLLERCHSYKDKIANGIKPSHGLFSYPILMTADILLMQAQHVPVGKDQKQHIEVAQDIAQKFNHVYGDVFVVPQPEIQDATAQIPGIDGRKMSKSYENTIGIFENDKSLKSKVMSIKTDSTPIESAKSIIDNPLYEIYSAFLDTDQRDQLRDRFETPGLRYGDVKQELLACISKYFKVFKEKRNELQQNKDYVYDVLETGAKKANLIAEQTMLRVRDAVGLSYRKYSDALPN